METLIYVLLTLCLPILVDPVMFYYTLFSSTLQHMRLNFTKFHTKFDEAGFILPADIQYP